LLHGAVAPDRDYALGVFPGLDGDGAAAGHLFARAPIPIRKQPLQPGEMVEHYGTLRRRALGGTVRAGNATDEQIELILPDGSRAGYGPVLAVTPHPDQDVFSIPGESGSLVFDANRLAVGTLLGASADGAISYVLDLLSGLRSALGGDFELFFQEG
jgi:hypothetical protein